MKAAANFLLCLALAVSLAPACSAGYVSLSPPVVMALLENIHNFLVCAGLWPFLFLQLLLCLNVKSRWVVLLIPGLSAAGLLAGFLFTIFCDLGAGGLLVIILSVVFFSLPLIGSLLGLLVWAALRRLGGLRKGDTRVP